MLDKKLHIGIVTPFPPSKGSLNEYAYHFVRAMGQKQDMVGRITLFVDSDGADVSGLNATMPINVESCWEFGALNNATQINKAVQRVQPDIVLFNIQFASFGEGKVPAALGLTTPLLIKKSGIPTAVLLHNIMELVDLNNTGHTSNWLNEKVVRGAGNVLTRLLLGSDLVAFTIPKYVELIREKYGADNVMLAPHGTFSDRSQAEPPSFELPEGKQQIMTFGKFGTYKKVEALIEAFDQLQQTRDLELVIAGADSPNVKGYLADVQARYAHVPNVRFTGYVAEEDVPVIFGEAAVVVFPYSSTTGSSGVLHQAGEFGKATVLPDIGDFAEVIREEGFTGEFFEPECVESMGNAIAAVLDNPDHRRQLAAQNYLAAKGLPISDVVDWYILHFQQICATQAQEVVVTAPEPSRRRPVFAPQPALSS